MSSCLWWDTRQMAAFWQLAPMTTSSTFTVSQMGVGAICDLGNAQDTRASLLTWTGPKMESTSCPTLAIMKFSIGMWQVAASCWGTGLRVKIESGRPTRVCLVSMSWVCGLRAQMGQTSMPCVDHTVKVWWQWLMTSVKFTCFSIHVPNQRHQVINMRAMAVMWLMYASHIMTVIFCQWVGKTPAFSNGELKGQVLETIRIICTPPLRSLLPSAIQKMEHRDTYRESREACIFLRKWNQNKTSYCTICCDTIHFGRVYLLLQNMSTFFWEVIQNAYKLFTTYIPKWTDMYHMLLCCVQIPLFGWIHILPQISHISLQNQRK